MLSAPQVFDLSVLSREDIAALLASYQLSLTIDEALTIQHQLLHRPPTLAELVLWSIQGSEHCSYKSTRTHLKQFQSDGPHVILGPSEDAGIVAVATDEAGHRYGVVMSHESHNHPSQVVPYEGAATGVGGNVRDVSCMGATVIAIADGLRFGELSRPKTHWVQSGVVSGIAGYGNPLGVPTLAGDVYYHPGYNDNCLVTVVTLGIVREDHVIHSYAPPKADDYVFILVGKPTDNSGFGGASFASATLSEAKHEQNKGAVQEPNAFLQRHLLKANMAMFTELQNEGLINRVGFKDLGAGGIACASVELAEAGGYGATIYLDQVPVGMPGLRPEVVLCSETQERFMWVVPSELAPRFLAHYNERFALPVVSAGARAAVIGELRHDGQYVVHSGEHILVNAKASNVTQGIRYDRPSTPPVVQATEPDHPEPTDYSAVLLRLLSHESIASREPIFEQYDKQVQGRTVIEAGAADAGVMQPFNDDTYPESIRNTGIALSLDQNPRFCEIDPYWGAVNAVLESVCNVVAVGASPIALTDCLCFGNPENPAQMGEFIAAVEGIAAACRAVPIQAHPGATLPVIAGNVSLYNNTDNGAIPPSPMISCLGVMSDVSRVITRTFKRHDSTVFLVGERKDECGGSVYYQLAGVLGANLPQPDFALFSQTITVVQAAMAQGWVLAAHDISDGGLAVALAEMCFDATVGVSVTLKGDLRLDKQLFSETRGFVLEVPRDKVKLIKALFEEAGVPLQGIGDTTREPRLRMNEVIDLPVATAKAAWASGLRDQLT